MIVIDEIMSNERAEWVDAKISEVPKRSRFRAANASRSPSWASAISKDPARQIPACYCALHATEEAIAAFVSTAKECGYDDAKKISIRDHQAQATVFLLSQELTDFTNMPHRSIGYHADTDLLVARLEENNKTSYHPLILQPFYFHNADHDVVDDFAGALLNLFQGDILTSRNAVLKVERARIGIFYADSSSFPVGFDNPNEQLVRESKISLGLIWASIDMWRNTGERVPLILQFLKTAHLVIKD